MSNQALASQTEKSELQELAARHLMMHFSDLKYDASVITRGEGCYVYDEEGNKYFDGLAGLFLSNVGHGRTEIADAVHQQLNQLHYFPLWTYSHPVAIKLAARLAALAPGDLNRAFFTTGGSEAVESAWKLAKQYFKAKGKPGKYKVIARDLAYHGTTMGALSVTGLEAIKEAFAPLTPGGFHARTTDNYRSEEQGEALAEACANDIERIIIEQGPDTVAAVYLEPVQNSGGCLPPPPGYFERVRKICDKHDVLLVSDEVICGFGRLGYLFACERYGYQPDIITCAKGLTSGYVPLGAAIVSDKIADAFLNVDETFLHGITFGGHPAACAAAMANLDIMEREDLCGNVRKNEGAFRAALETLSDLPIVGDIRGAGYFFGIELVKNRETKERLTEDECERTLRGILSPRLFELGLICRADDRGEPVIQLSPPLIATPEDFQEIARILRIALEEASEELS